MDFSGILAGFETTLSPTNLLFVTLGVLVGMVIGVIPGLGPTATIALLLPLTYGLDPATAVIMLAGIYYGSMYGGTITSVLLHLPGEAASVVTTFDGYQMAKQGRGGPALGIAAIGSFIGGIVSVVGLILVAPAMASFALRFGPAEFAVLAALGILMAAYLASKRFAAALLMACFGYCSRRWAKTRSTAVPGSPSEASTFSAAWTSLRLPWAYSVSANCSTPSSIADGPPVR
jgi:putative tricarboxylic transport membrane protein